VSIQDEETADLADALLPRLVPLLGQAVDRSIAEALERQSAAIVVLLDQHRAGVVKAVEQSFAGAVAGSTAGTATGDEIARLRDQIADQYRDFTALLRQPARTTAPPRDIRSLALAAVTGAVLLVVLLRVLPAGFAGSLAGIAPDRTGGFGALMVERAGPAFQKCLVDARAAGRVVTCNVSVAP
jgi:hypothetical protein